MSKAPPISFSPAVLAYLERTLNARVTVTRLPATGFGYTVVKAVTPDGRIAASMFGDECAHLESTERIARRLRKLLDEAALADSGGDIP